MSRAEAGVAPAGKAPPRRAPWLRFFVLSVVFAVLMSVMFLAALRQLIGRPSEEIQRNLYLFYAHVVEEQPYAAAIARAQRYRWQYPPLPLELWVLDDDNQVLASSGAGAPPDELLAMEKPREVHELHATRRGYFREAGAAIVKLDAAPSAYLLIRNPGATRQGFLGFLGLFIATLVCASFFGLFMVAMYLRGRSAQARQVIADLEAGRLGARFQVNRLDAAGGLMLDFNRMAGQIQRLVTRLEATERKRRELLQELGHDLRTPLTSVRTAVDTLVLHGEVMGGEERAEFHVLVASEIDYLAKLMDDLFFIADIEDPTYRQQREEVDLSCLVTTELRQRRGDEVLFDVRGADVPWVISGDAHLLVRLLRNLFDNAARHAQALVLVSLRRDGAQLELVIEDDGPGMNSGQLKQYGERRSLRLAEGERPLSASLGLGSVIAAKIVELHGGKLEVASDMHLGGARITLRFDAL